MTAPNANDPVSVPHERIGTTVMGEVLVHQGYGYVYACLYRQPEGRDGNPFVAVPFTNPASATTFIDREVKRHDAGYYQMSRAAGFAWSVIHESRNEAEDGAETNTAMLDDALDYLPDEVGEGGDEIDEGDIEPPPDVFGGHEGFWMDVDGTPAHFLADPNMDPKTQAALEELVRAARHYVETHDFTDDDDDTINNGQGEESGE